MHAKMNNIQYGPVHLSKHIYQQHNRFKIPIQAWSLVRSTSLRIQSVCPQLINYTTYPVPQPIAEHGCYLREE